MITSLHNEHVKAWRKLHTKKGRLRAKKFLIEGFHLIEEALKSNWIIDQLIVQEAIDVPRWMSHIPCRRVSSAVFKQIAQTEAPQGIAAVVMMKQLTRSEERRVGKDGRRRWRKG